MALYYLRIRKESPQEGEYNPLQKLAYTSVFFVLTPLIMLSGMAMSPQLDTAFHWLPAMFGGRQSARSIHFILTFLFIGFTFGHVFMVLVTSALNNMRSMVTGWYKESGVEEAELESCKEELTQESDSAPVATPLVSPELKESPPAEETPPAGAGAASQDNGMSKSTTQDEQADSESLTQSSRTQTHETKKE